jgi:hypothetical protein
MAWRDPRVRSVAQFLLFDSKPVPRYQPTSFNYWDTFQTGLLYADTGKPNSVRPKPAFSAYRLPIWLPSTRVAGGGDLFVWGQLRPGPDATRLHAKIQWRRKGGRYRTIATVTVPAKNTEGYFTTRVRPPGTGYLRIAWSTYGSRGVAVTVG